MVIEIKKRVLVKEGGLVGTLKNILGKGRSVEVKAERRESGYVLLSTPEPPEVEHPEMGKTKAYGGSIVVGGVGATGFTFVYHDLKFRRKAVELASEHPRFVRAVDDPRGVLRLLFTPPSSSKEFEEFLRLYGRLILMWHKHHG